jgi:transcriptional regulator with XRE-family HTH domain
MCLTFGEKLRRARKNKGLKQEEVARIVGIDDTTLSKYENNKSEPDNETLQKLIDLYGISADFLFKEKKEQTKNDLNEAMKQLVEEYNKLSHENKIFVTELIRRMQNK